MRVIVGGVAKVVIIASTAEIGMLSHDVLKKLFESFCSHNVYCIGGKPWAYRPYTACETIPPDRVRQVVA